jgi:hypothetical protein
VELLDTESVDADRLKQILVEHVSPAQTSQPAGSNADSHTPAPPQS